MEGYVGDDGPKELALEPFLAPDQQKAVDYEEAPHHRDYDHVLVAGHHQHVYVEEDSGDKKALQSGALLPHAEALVELFQRAVAKSAKNVAEVSHFPRVLLFIHFDTRLIPKSQKSRIYKMYKCSSRLRGGHRD